MTERKRTWGAPVPLDKGNVPENRGEVIDPKTGKTHKPHGRAFPANGVSEDRGEEAPKL